MGGIERDDSEDDADADVEEEAEEKEADEDVLPPPPPPTVCGTPRKGSAELVSLPPAALLDLRNVSASDSVEKERKIGPLNPFTCSWHSGQLVKMPIRRPFATA